MEIILPAYKAVGERRYRETSGLYFEDFESGRADEVIDLAKTNLWR
jgi:hypothetical protein